MRVAIRAISGQSSRREMESLHFQESSDQGRAAKKNDSRYELIIPMHSQLIVGPEKETDTLEHLIRDKTPKPRYSFPITKEFI